MMIAPHSRARKGGKEREEVKGEYKRIWGEEEGNADYGGMVQPSQQHVAPCVKGVWVGIGHERFLVAVYNILFELSGLRNVFFVHLMKIQPTFLYWFT